MQKIISIGQVRSLLNHLEAVRRQVLTGKVTGYYATVIEGGKEDLHIAGCYETDARKAAKAFLRISAARVIEEDEPPLFQERIG